MRQQQSGQRREQYEERLPNLFLVEIGEVRGNRRHPRDYRLSEDAPYREIITSESPQAAKKLVEWSEHLGEFLARRGLTTSQIRKVFGEVRRLWMEAQKGWTDVLTRKVHLLIPKLEYAARKEVAVKALRAVLVPSIREVLEGGNHDEIRKRFERFVEFFEAILAYHYAFGGK
ncbi:type III-A CRISPR-associated protein Csm2 [Fervidibacter sp.]|jgi:CRISPR-associated protein Csm2